MKRHALCLVAALAALTLARPAGAADADLPTSRHLLRGDLGSGERDRVAFTAPAGTRLDLRLESTSEDLELSVRVVGPSGVVAPGDRLRIRDEGRKLRLRRLKLREDGLYRVEVIGAGAGIYEGRIDLDLPSRAERSVALGPPAAGPPVLDVAVPPDAVLRKIRVKARSAGLGVGFATFSNPEDDPVSVQLDRRTRGFRLLPEEALAAGLHRLTLTQDAGAGDVKVKVTYGVQRSERTLLDLTDGTTAPPSSGDDSVEGELLVRLASGTRLDEFRKRHGDLDIEAVDDTGYYRIELEDDEDEDALLQELLDDPAVLHAEKNLVAQVPEGGQSSLPALDDNLDEEQFLSQPGLERIGVTAAHARATGLGRVVAVVDTGIDPDHPLFAGRIAPGGIDLVDRDGDPREMRNGLDDDGDGQIDEGYGHGTFVAGLVLAVAPDARILPIRVLDSDARGDAARIAAGVMHAVAMGVDVINLSLGTINEARIIREATKFAHDHGIVVVVAAGNDADQIQFPARYGNTLAVTAVDALGVAAPFTNLGSAADLAAPGVDMIGPMPVDSGATWARWSGTSFSAPLVSGSAALVRQAFPAFKGDQIASRLMDTSENIDLLNPTAEGLLGKGLVRPDRAVQP